MFFGGDKKVYSVRTLGDESLRSVARKIDSVDGELRDLAQSMIATLAAFEGIGLAAPQLGVNRRLVVLDIPKHAVGAEPTPGEVLLLPRMPMALINPEIVSSGAETGLYSEGCLSIPDIYADVERPLTVVLKAELLDGSSIECECGGLLGRCIQHELDHLDGRLFIDRLGQDEARRIDRQLRSLRRFGASHRYMRQIKR